MNRFFSMIRRRPNYVDLVIPRQSGVDGYRIQSSPNFDGAWTTRITAPVGGYIDPAINPAVVDFQNLGVGPFGPPVRVIFDPATYSITDTSSFWLRFVPVTGGAPGTAGAPTLVLPSAANHGVGIVTIRGQAPSGADATAALQLDLPRLMQDFQFHCEDGANDLFVSTEQSGPETQIPGPSSDQQTLSIFGTASSIWVRGAGGAVNFSASFTAAFPR